LANGADLIAEKIVQQGLKRVFLFPGGTIAPILETLEKRGVELFVARHEQGAGYAALAVARLTGQPQVVLVTSGPGVTNIATVVADAYYDSTPLIVMCGQVGTADLSRSSELRQRGFQEVPTTKLYEYLSKDTYQPTCAEDLAHDLHAAFWLAAEGRPGPVVLDIPMDVQRKETTCPLGIGNYLPSASWLDDMSEVAEMLASAKRPVIIAGQGVLLDRAQEELRWLVDTTQIPVSHSLLGIGALPKSHPLNLGYHGHTGSQVAGKAIYNADLLLVLGSRLDVRQTGTETARFAPRASIVRVDIDMPEIQHTRVKTNLQICACVGETLRKLNTAIGPTADKHAWHAEIAAWRKEFVIDNFASRALRAVQVVQELDAATQNQAVTVVTGVGLHQQWVARHFSFNYPWRTLLTSGGHGAMGYDLPSAIGAQLYDTERLVLCIVGDGSFQMNIQELATVAEHEMPLKIFVLNNFRLGIVSQFQNLNWKRDLTCGNKYNPDFSSIAKAYGIRSYTTDSVAHLRKVLGIVLQDDKPVVVNCLCDPKEDITPMLLAGQTIDKMWTA